MEGPLFISPTDLCVVKQCVFCEVEAEFYITYVSLESQRLKPLKYV
jgi:hypothetical protein